jgi:hypothetical protein
MLPGKFRQIIKLLLIHTVGTGTDDYADDLRMAESLFVKNLQPLKRGISVRISLEIRQIVLGCAVTHLMELYSLVHLLMETLACSAVGRMEGCIVAVGTSSAAYLSVTVRTCESGIKHDLLKTLAILALEIPYERIVSFPFRETIFFKIL